MPAAVPVRTSHFWRWLAAAAILGNIALSYYSNLRVFNGQSMGDVSAKHTTLLTPAGYAFAIWGLIFLALVLYAGWQLLPAQRANPLPDAVAKSLILANLGCAAWVMLFAHERFMLALGVMLLVLVALMFTYGTARDLIRGTHVAPRWVSIPFALFLGWISVATVLNVTIALQAVGFRVDAGLALKLAYVALALLIIVILILARVFQERMLPLVAAWALVGIWAARISAVPDLAWVALAGAVAVLILGLVLAQQGRKLQPWEISAAAAAAAEAEIQARTHAASSGAEAKPAH